VIATLVNGQESFSIMIMLKTIYLLIILMSISFACSAPRSAVPDKDNDLAYPEKAYSEPEIGMDIREFMSLCQPNAEKTQDDNYSSLKNAQGLVMTYRLGYTEKRAAKRCWGTFTLINGTWTQYLRISYKAIVFC
jgi:hypothetical protein